MAPVVALIALLTAASTAQAQHLPDHYLNVPIMRQATAYSCGPAALLSVLYYWRVDQDSSEDDLYAVTGATPADGTEPEGLVRGARSHGLQAEYYRDGEYNLGRLQRALRRGDTVIVGYQAWIMDRGHGRVPPPEPAAPEPHWPGRWDDGHYSVVVGLDASNIYLMDPSAGVGYGYMPVGEFLTRWHDVERDGQGRWIHHQRMAIEIHGDHPLPGFPGPLVRVM
jgi:predicted double-glycine peptidase